MSVMTKRDVNQECEYCVDLTKRLCLECRVEVMSKLEYLGRKLAVAAALCRAWRDGWISYEDCYWCDPHWKPGCGRPVPKVRPE